MSVSDIYITSSCVISKNIVYKDGEQLFVSTADGLSAFLSTAYLHFECRYPKFYKMDSLSKLGWLATEILLNGSDLTLYSPDKKGLLLTNANSSLDTDLKYFETTKEIPSPALFVYTLPNIVMGEICIRHHFKGENAFFIFEQFNANFIRQYVSELIKNDVLQTCICGWVDVLNESYKAVLFLVEERKVNQSIPFTEENINNIFKQGNG